MTAQPIDRVELPPADRAPGFGRALAYELAAFRATRANWVLMAAALATQLLLTVLAHRAGDPGDLTFEKTLSVAWVFSALIAALGVNAFGTEYRYRTIITTALTVRSRAHVLLAKAIVVVAAAVLIQAVALAASWLVLAVLLGAAPTVPTSLALGFGTLCYIALVTLIGLALAGLVRGSVLPIALLVVWPEVEMLLINRLDLPRPLLLALEPFYSARGLIAPNPDWPMVLPMLVLTAVLLALTGLVLDRRDV